MTEADRGQLLRSLPWRLVSYLFPQLNLIIISISAARFLGPAQMGQQSYMAFVSVTTVALAQGGVPTAVTRFLGESFGAHQTARARAVHRWGVAANGVMAVAGTAVIAGVAVTAGSYQAAWALLAAITLLSIMNGLSLATLSAFHRWRFISLLYLVNDAVTVGLTIGVLAAGFGITGMFAAETVGAIVPFLVFWRAGRRELSRATAAPVGEPEPDLGRRLTRFAAVMTLQVLVVYIIFRRTELFFLRRYSTNREIAIYSIAFASMSALQQLPQALQAVLLPKYSSLVGAGRRAALRDAVSRTVRLMASLAVAITAVGAALAPRAIDVFYGTPYHAAGSVLLILIPAVAIVPVTSVCSSAVNALGLQRWPLAFAVVGCLIDVAVAAALVPSLGARGAAIAGVSAQVGSTLPIVVYARARLGGLHVDWRSLAASAGAAGVAGGLAYAGTLVPGALGLVIGLLLGAAGYLLAGRALRVLGADDARWLDEGAGNQLRGLVGRTVRWLGQAA